MEHFQEKWTPVFRQRCDHSAEKRSTTADGDTTEQRQDADRFPTDPSRYPHWKLKVERDTATLLMDVDEKGALLGGSTSSSTPRPRRRYRLPERHRAAALSSIRRVRVLLRSAEPRAGVLRRRQYPHAGRRGPHHKVNFCKFTNETRGAIEDADATSGVCVINGTAPASSGYELALATDRVVLHRRWLLGGVAARAALFTAVLPRTGGLAHVTEQGGSCTADHAVHSAPPRKASRAPAPSNGGLVDEAVPGSSSRRRLRAAQAGTRRRLAAPRRETGRQARSAAARSQRQHGRVQCCCMRGSSARSASPPITLRGPAGAAVPLSRRDGRAFWPLRLARELDDTVSTSHQQARCRGNRCLASSGDPAQVPVVMMRS